MYIRELKGRRTVLAKGSVVKNALVILEGNTKGKKQKG